jgi:hypothetical protein
MLTYGHLAALVMMGIGIYLYSTRRKVPVG